MSYPHGAFSIHTQSYNSETVRDHPYKPKKKRQQVKNACVNCQKACKKCDEGRPCSRCIKYGLTDTCADSPRKARKKGVKRGPYKRRKVLSNVSGSKAKGQVRARDMVPETDLCPQSQKSGREGYATAQASYLQRSSAFSPVPSRPSLGEPSLEDLSKSTSTCGRKNEKVNSINALLNPQVQGLQRPQPRRFSVELPLPLKIDLAPRASSVEPDHQHPYGHGAQWSSRGSTRGGLSIEIPKLPSITTITSKVNQPPTPMQVLPPLMNIPSVAVQGDDLREKEGKRKGEKWVNAEGVRKRSISPSESDNSLPASPVDFGRQQQQSMTKGRRLPPINCTSPIMYTHCNEMTPSFFANQPLFAFNRV